MLGALAAVAAGALTVMAQSPQAQTVPSETADPPRAMSDPSQPEPHRDDAEGRRASEADPGKAQQGAAAPPAVAPLDEAPQRHEEARQHQPDAKAESGYDLGDVGSVAAALFAALAVGVYAYQAFLMRQTLVSTNRAFVFLKGVTSYYLTDPDNPNRLWGWRFAGTWENSGNTPTSRMMAYASWNGFRGGMPADFSFAVQAGDAPGPLLVGPKHGVHTAGMAIPMPVLLDAAADKCSIYLWGWADYSDVFRNTPRHRTEFCYRLVVHSDPRDKECVFTFLLHDRHNGADDECYREPEKAAPPRPRRPTPPCAAPPRGASGAEHRENARRRRIAFHANPSSLGQPLRCVAAAT